MKYLKLFKKISGYSGILFLIILYIAYPSVCKEGVSSAIIISTSVIIPSLFPFTVCVLFMLRSGVAEKAKVLSPVTKRIFGLDGALFTIMLFSFIGGYPIGTKLINEAVKAGKMSPESGRTMLNYSVNAGPAFIIGAVGNGIFHSKSFGIMLFFSHITASLAICIILKLFGIFPKESFIKKDVSISFTDNFVLSVCDASAVTLNICSYIIFFSSVTSYLLFLSKKLPALQYCIFFTEVTSAVVKAKNVYFISFLLGFAGLSVWAQIISLGKDIKINFFYFALSRIVHGVLSAGILLVSIKLFGASLPTVSFAGVNITGIITAPSLLIFVILFVIYMNSPKENIKLSEEFI